MKKQTIKTQATKQTGVRQELGQVGPNSWKHVRADGQVVIITVPGR